MSSNSDADFNATFGGSALESLDLSETQITTINAATFMGATKLATVKLPAGVTTIGTKAFKDTTALKTLTQGPATPVVGGGYSVAKEENGNKLTASINSINNYAFQNTGLTSIDLTDTNITGASGFLGNSVFQYAAELATLKLPSKLTTIPAGFVAGATKLTQLTIPASVTKINGGNNEFPGAFQGSGIQNIDLSGTALTTWASADTGVNNRGTFQGDASLTEVKLPLKLAQSSGIARDAFKGCTNDKLSTIEFDFTTANATTGLDTLGANADANKTALTNIYKMFAASGNEFTNNSGESAIQTPTVDKLWLSKHGDDDNTITSDTTKHNYSVTLNGITWTALATKPGADANSDPIPTEGDGGIGKITSETTQVTITGTLPANTTGGFKYKYTNSDGTLPTNNQSQQLPSNITTIKIVLKKGETDQVQPTSK